MRCFVSRMGLCVLALLCCGVCRAQAIYVPHVWIPTYDYDVAFEAVIVYPPYQVYNLKVRGYTKFLSYKKPYPGTGWIQEIPFDVGDPHGHGGNVLRFRSRPSSPFTRPIQKVKLFVRMTWTNASGDPFYWQSVTVDFDHGNDYASNANQKADRIDSRLIASGDSSAHGPKFAIRQRPLGIASEESANIAA